MLPLALTHTQKSVGLLEIDATLTFIAKVQISDTRCFDKTLSKLLKIIHLSLDSSHVCLNNYEEGCRNHNV